MQGEPYIPETITVHLGRPDDSSAPNVTVPFPDYVKNVASSEIYPTWPENAIRANIYVIVSYALNRIYTEWYRSRGYDFDITNTTQYDQAFVQGRDIFQPISEIVDELFNDYIRKEGAVEPFFAAFCNGTTSTCDGLSQWGTVDLAKRGYTPYEILKHYYGDDINIVFNAPVQTYTPSYPGTPLQVGDAGSDVKTIQIQLNRISSNYPALGKIYPVDGFYTKSTEDAVRNFQRIFQLPQTGIVNEATWYRISYIYTSVKRLAELNSEGIAIQDIPSELDYNLSEGMQGKIVRALQYYLTVIGAYYEDVSAPSDLTGYFGPTTKASVESFQRVYGLPVTGVVDSDTWTDIHRAYAGIVENVPLQTNVEAVPLYPEMVLREGVTSPYVRVMQQYLTYIHDSYPQIPAVSDTGYYGPLTRAAVTAFQREFGIQPTGAIGLTTWNAIASVYSDLRYGYVKKPGEYPGYIIRATPEAETSSP